MLKREEKDEGEILGFLSRGAATVEQLAEGTNIDESTLRLKLMELKREGWVKERRAKTTLLTCLLHD